MTWRIFWLTARPTREGAATVLLPFAAFALVATLVAVVLGGARKFWAFDDDTALMYQGLAGVALALLLVPLLSLGTAAARLSARRRDDRLATLRLVGATGSLTARLTVLESGLVALAGATVGVTLSYLLSPLVGRIPFRGAPLTAAGVALPWWGALAVVLGLTMVSVLASLVALRRVVISPLGVTARTDAPRIGRAGVVVAALGLVGAMLLLNNLGALGGGPLLVAGLGGAFALGVAALDAIGPWFVGIGARRRLRRGERPADLMAARMILESPRAAWRQVSGVAMSSFVAVVAGAGLALLEQAGRGDGLTATDLTLIADIRTGVLITVTGTFLTVACTVGVNQAAQILDRRDAVGALHVLGTPLAVQAAARRRAVTGPLLLASLGSALAAAALLLPLVGAALLLAPLSVAMVVGSVAVGILLVRSSLLLTRPLLRATAAAR